MVAEVEKPTVRETYRTLNRFKQHLRLPAPETSISIEENGLQEDWEKG